jgi:hypothetical protein
MNITNLHKIDDYESKWLQVRTNWLPLAMESIGGATRSRGKFFKLKREIILTLDNDRSLVSMPVDQDEGHSRIVFGGHADTSAFSTPERHTR